jgi:DNA-binding SARP family transcriptional activator
MRRADSSAVSATGAVPGGRATDSSATSTAVPSPVDNPAVILTEKLRRPEPGGLGRDRLESPLVEGVPGSRLHVVVGPPGSGKTTLLARVCAAATVPTAWYRLTADDTVEATLLAHLARALGDIVGRPLDHRTMSDLLADVERSPDTPALLVLDDVHEIADTLSERSLEQFVALRPQGLRLIVGSRRHPDLNTLRLRLWGELHETCGDDLRFRSWEVEDLFRNVFHCPLAPEAAAALTRRTGGWAAGLQLFQLATRGRSRAERHRAVNELNGRSRLIRSYLVRNVVGELPEDRRRFLLTTSTLGTLTGELCDRLLDTVGSASVLDELEQQQLFTSSDDDGRTFRYHEVLRAHLEWALLEEYGPERARSWYARSAALLESAGMVSAAVRAHARAENWGAVAALVQTRGSDPATTSTGMDVVLPPAVVRFDPWLSLTEARRQMRAGAVTTAAAIFEQAENLLDEPAFRDSCRRERAVALMWTAAPPDPRSAPVHWSTVVRAATRRVDTVPLRSGADDGARLGAGLALLLAGDLTGAAAVTGPLDEASDPTHRLLGRLTDAVVTGLDGPADLAGGLGRIALEAEYAGLPWVERLSRGLAEAFLVAQGAPAWRAEACDAVRGECERAGDLWGAAVLQMALATAFRTADPGRSAEEFAAAGRCFLRLDAPVPATWCEVLGAAVLAEQGDPDAAAIAGRGAATARRLGLVRAVDVADAVVSHGAGAAAAAPDGADPAAPDRRATAGTHRPPPMSVHCLGPFRLEIDGVPVDLTGLRPRARAVLRMLAMAAGREIHQERLVDAFWPDADVPVGVRRLQVALSSVRQVLEPHGPPGRDWLPRRDNGYRLAFLSGSRLDVLTFTDQLALARAAPGPNDVGTRIRARTRALELYCGELLPEDGAAEHVVVERERYRLAAAGAAAALGTDLRTVGRLEEAIAAAERSIQLESFQDAAWLLLATLYDDAGDTTAALRVRLQHARVIAELVPAGT